MEARHHQTHHGRDGKSGSCSIHVEKADWFNVISRQPDFLLGLAKRGVGGSEIARVWFAAGKCNLPGVGGEVRGALGEKDRERITCNDWNKDGGGPGGRGTRPFSECRRVQIKVAWRRNGLCRWREVLRRGAQTFPGEGSEGGEFDETRN